jgi:hypothetical protein
MVQGMISRGGFALTCCLYSWQGLKRVGVEFDDSDLPNQHGSHLIGHSLHDCLANYLTFPGVIKQSMVNPAIYYTCANCLHPQN